MPRHVLVGIALFALGCSSAVFAALTPEQVKSLPPAAARPVNFTADIKPVLEASCVNCHGRGRVKGGLRLDDRASLLAGGDSGPAVVPGKSAESYLIELVAGVDPDNVMPQKGKRLTPEQVGLVRAWIDQGLPWEKEISFAKPAPKNLVPRRPEVPAARKELNSGNPIDRFIDRYFAEQKIEWREPVDDRLYARRVYLDIIGLPPSPAEMECFLTDKSPERRARLVRTLLDDNQRYAEHWLSFWNDLLRNDYRGTGYIDNGRKQITSWLFSALLTNAPYDKFVRQLINPNEGAEGFTKGIVWRGVVNASQSPPMQAAQNISQVFMGVNLKCASCHDSFINNWTLAEAYGLANIYSDKPLEIFHCDKPTGKTAGIQFIYPELGEIDAKADKPARLKQLAEVITSPKDGRLPRTIVNRLWARFFGRGLVEPQDDMEQPSWHPDLLDWLAEDFVAHGWDLKHAMLGMLTSRAYELPSVGGVENTIQQTVFRGPYVRRVSAEQFRDMVGAVTGTWHSDPEGDFDFSILRGEQGRPELTAKWIWADAGAREKATAEVLFFRRQFSLEQVPERAEVLITCDNSFTLYVNGKEAASGSDFTKPVMADLKRHLHKGANVIAVRAVNHLPDNSKPKDGEAAPESAANPAGLLLQLLADGGPVVISDSEWKFARGFAEGWNRIGHDPTGWKNAAELGSVETAPWNLKAQLVRTASRNVLHNQVRASLVSTDPLTTALGRPNREQVTTSRPSSATTLQALELTNGETLAKIFQHGAAEFAQGDRSPEGLVEEIYRRALSRPPTGGEKDLAMSMVGKPVRAGGVEDFLWALAMLPEFQLIY